MYFSKTSWRLAAAIVAALSLISGNAHADFDIYIEYNPGGVGSIQKYPSTGGAGTLFASGFAFPEGLVRDPLGNFYLVDQNVGNLLKLGPAGGSPITLATPGNAPYDVAIDAAGNLYVAVFGTG